MLQSFKKMAIAIRRQIIQPGNDKKGSIGQQSGQIVQVAPNSPKMSGNDRFDILSALINPHTRIMPALHCTPVSIY